MIRRVSYVYVPILIPILVLLPYVMVKYYQRSHRINQLVESLSQSNRDLEQMSPWRPQEPLEAQIRHQPAVNPATP